METSLQDIITNISSNYITIVQRTLLGRHEYCGIGKTGEHNIIIVIMIVMTNPTINKFMR